MSPDRPTVAPEWLVEALVRRNSRQEAALTDLSPAFRKGSRDEDLFSVTLAFMRRGYDDDSVRAKLRALLDNGAVENTSDDPITYGLIDEKIRSARKFLTERDTSITGTVPLPAGMQSDDEEHLDPSETIDAASVLEALCSIIACF